MSSLRDDRASPGAQSIPHTLAPVSPEDADVRCRVAHQTQYGVFLYVSARASPGFQALARASPVPCSPPPPQSGLLRAAAHCDLHSVRRFLAAGARVHATDGRGRTPLWIASEKQSLPVVEELLAAGADHRPDMDEASPLWVASANGAVGVIRALARAGASHAPKNNGMTPLAVAAHFGHGHACEALVEEGASHTIGRRCSLDFANNTWDAPKAVPALVRTGGLRAMAALDGEERARRVAGAALRRAIGRGDREWRPFAAFLREAAPFAEPELLALTALSRSTERPTRVLEFCRREGIQLRATWAEIRWASAGWSREEAASAPYLAVRWGVVTPRSLANEATVSPQLVAAVSSLIASAPPAQRRDIAGELRGARHPALRFLAAPSRDLALAALPRSDTVAWIALFGGHVSALEAFAARSELAAAVWAIRLPLASRARVAEFVLGRIGACDM